MVAFFYIEQTLTKNQEITLSEETSRHISGVLRMKEGGFIRLTNGKGILYDAVIQHSHKKKTVVRIGEFTTTAAPDRHITIAISLLKNSNRFEWFLEKATEIGVRTIIPVISERTEKQHFRYERMKNILVSAMLQSQQVWIPELSEPVSFKALFSLPLVAHSKQKLIAHCEEGVKLPLAEVIDRSAISKIILIGPEGDFNSEEIGLAKDFRFQPVTLGSTRLRTETAGIVAATLLQLTY